MSHDSFVWGTDWKWKGYSLIITSSSGSLTASVESLIQKVELGSLWFMNESFRLIHWKMHHNYCMIISELRGDLDTWFWFPSLYCVCLYTCFSKRSNLISCVCCLCCWRKNNVVLFFWRLLRTALYETIEHRQQLSQSYNKNTSNRSIRNMHYDFHNTIQESATRSLLHIYPFKLDMSLLVYRQAAHVLVMNL